MKNTVKKQAEDKANHKAQLEEKHGLTGHPKADSLYSIAWGMGHSAGYSEVESCYNDMAHLLKPAVRSASACSCITVTIEITDPETVEAYKDVDDDLVFADLCSGNLMKNASLVSRENS